MSVWYHSRLDVVGDFLCTPESIYGNWLLSTGWVYIGEFE